ncbi:Membrane-bound lytic murein transglycosylase A [Granulibacter bethesdensis]|nr:Membrane-bound lytic murein transglycosylase A [Granulibacter bethesdensis]
MTFQKVKGFFSNTTSCMLCSMQIKSLYALFLMVVLASCAQTGRVGQLQPVALDDLPGWQTDHVARGVAVFARECDRLLTLPNDQTLGGAADQAARLGGQPDQWRPACKAVQAIPEGDEEAARAFVQRYFQAYAISSAPTLFTGYYEPEVEGSRSPIGRYRTPLLRRPDDLVSMPDPADPGGKYLSGRMVGGQLEPYYTRAEIEAGALKKQRLGLVWLADPIDAFFLQIQGSGRVRLPDGHVVRVTYAGKNGRPYVPIGKVLIERGEMTADQVSEASIRDWLRTHPDQAQEIMNANPSFVFFRELTGMPGNEGAPGTLGVPLSAGRSVAVDRRIVPLGAPVWVDTTDPGGQSALQRLMVAQDTGSAISGMTRADIYFGYGPQAKAVAGQMNQQGRLYVLLPKATE